MSKSKKAKGGKKKQRDIGAAITKLDVSTLHDDAITDVMLHCASALNLRKAIDNPSSSPAGSSASYCYTKSGSSSTVSIWSGGFKVGETSDRVADF